MEPQPFGAALLRGAEGEVVGRVGAFGVRPRLSRTVAVSDTAVYHDRRFERLWSRAAVLLLFGSLLVSGAGLSATPDEPRIELLLAGAALTLHGTVLASTASRAFSRAVWWYNSTLAR